MIRIGKETKIAIILQLQSNMSNVNTNERTNKWPESLLDPSNPRQCLCVGERRWLTARDVPLSTLQVITAFLAECCSSVWASGSRQGGWTATWAEMTREISEALTGRVKWKLFYMNWIPGSSRRRNARKCQNNLPNLLLQSCNVLWLSLKITSTNENSGSFITELQWSFLVWDCIQAIAFKQTEAD